MPEIMSMVAIMAVVLIVLYIVINAFSKTNNLTKLMSGKTEKIITASDLKNTNTGNNFTYSMWLYIEDWNYRWGDEKIILNRSNCPRVSLSEKPNQLVIKIKTASSTTQPDGTSSPNLADTAKNLANKTSCEACQQGFTCACDSCDMALFNATEAVKTSTPSPYATPSAAQITALATAKATATQAEATGGLSVLDSGYIMHSCIIDAIPIQKWVNIIISLYQQTLDVYLEGKLVKTCVLPGVAVVNNNASIYVTPKQSSALDGGFSGWSSSFRLMPYASNPQEAYNIYKDGFGGSILANAMSKYRLRFSLIKDNKESGGFEI